MEETLKNDNFDEKRPWLFKKGNKFGKGRPKGRKTLKEFARQYLMSLPDDEKVEFLNFLPADLVWRMAEGNPANKTDVTSDNKPIQILGGISTKNVQTDNGTQ